VSKKDVIFCAIVIALGLVFAGVLGYIREYYTGELADARQLSDQYRSELAGATERITILEASNSRLNGYLRSASGNAERLESLTRETISDTRAASRLVKEIAIQVQSLIGELNGWRSAGSGGDSLDHLGDM
jgi:hypothetical protein